MIAETGSGRKARFKDDGGNMCNKRILTRGAVLAVVMASVAAVLSFAPDAQATSRGGRVTCSVPKAPTIQVLPKTKDIAYDYSQTTQQLTARRTTSPGPYGSNIDTATGGLRADQISTSSNIKMGTMVYQSQNAGCIWYDEVTVNINLNPVIYVAKEYQKEPCKGAILKHELRHVEVDRFVVNKYAQQIGAAIQNTVNKAGAVGPFPASDMNRQQDQLIKHIQAAIKSQEHLLDQEMRTLQSQVDSLEEYERISKICKDLIPKRR